MYNTPYPPFPNQCRCLLQDVGSGEPPPRPVEALTYNQVFLAARVFCLPLTMLAPIHILPDYASPLGSSSKSSSSSYGLSLPSWCILHLREPLDARPEMHLKRRSS